MNCYTNDEPTIAALNASGQTFEEALSTFTVSTHKALENLGKTPVVWEGKLKFESCLHRCGLMMQFRDGPLSQRDIVPQDSCSVSWTVRFVSIFDLIPNCSVSGFLPMMLKLSPKRASESFTPHLTSSTL